MDKQKAIREEIIRISGSKPVKCMSCGKCSATYPAYDQMEYHPHQFVNMIENGNIEPLMNSQSIYKCLTCFACVERCPRGVEPAKLIEAVSLNVNYLPLLLILNPKSVFLLPHTFNLVRS